MDEELAPIIDGAAAGLVYCEELSLFIQDQWQVSNRLTVQYGVRWDAQLLP